MQIDIIENVGDWQKRYTAWNRGTASDQIDDAYPLVTNRRAPFRPARRALPMLNLALISSAGAYIDGTEPFDVSSADGDSSFKEIPSEVEAHDLKFAARGYDTTAVQRDLNTQVPLERLFEFEQNGIIGQVNAVFWSLSGFIPNAALLVNETIPKLVQRILRYEVQATLLVPASRLCHQSMALIGRGIELAGIPSMMLAVDKQVIEMVRPPRAALNDAGQFGSVAGAPDWPEHQRRVLDEALRLIEPMDSPGFRILDVNLESEVEKERGER